MSEPKRATLSTISTQKSDVKKVIEVSKTVRFSLILPESNEKACPEYNYRDLLNSAEKKNKSKEKTSHVPPNGINHDPFEDNDDDVKRIARQFEQKYGMPLKPTKRRGKKDDYADIGAGYDESDSFIDNTDAYDEMVPEDVTTLHGGFYINSGALEFKQVEISASDDSSDVETPEKPVCRKRIIEDSDESNSDENEKEEDTKAENPEKKQKIEVNGVPKFVKKKIVLDDKEQILKKKKMEENAPKKKCITVKDLLREKRDEVNLTLEEEDFEIEKDSTKPASSNITAVIESVVNAGRADNIDETSKDSSSTDGVAVVSATSSDSESSRDGVPPVVSSAVPTVAPSVPPSVLTSAQSITEPQVEASKLDVELVIKLPENLPSNILDIINEIKKAAENPVGKVKFFSGPVNTLFLNLEIQCRKLGKHSRLQIYEHLAPFVKCKKDTLMRRAKNLVLDEERSKIKEPLKKLETAVTNIMPKVIKHYEKELQKAKDKLFLAGTENGNPNKVLKVPRKRFPFTDEIKKLLHEIIIVKKKCYTLEGIRKETFEEHIETFVKISVVCLWPESWMTTTLLMKHVKLIIDANMKPKALSCPLPMSPISLDVHATSAIQNPPFSLSPVKNMSLSPTSTSHVSAITVIPIPPTNRTTSLSAVASSNVSKLKQNPASAKSSELSISVSKVADLSTSSAVPVHNMSADVSPLTNSKDNALLSPVPVTANKSSVTITSVDLRTNPNKDTKVSDSVPTISSDICKIVNPGSSTMTNIDKTKNLKQQIRESSDVAKNNDDCQIIDLTETSSFVRKPGPKSKTRYIEASHLKSAKRILDSSAHRPILKHDENSVIHRKTEEITGTQALNHLITGLTKFGSNLTENNQKPYKDSQTNEDEMEQVMKDLKELQQMQEHTRKNEIDIMAPSSSPVSVIAYNTSFSPTKVQVSDLSSSKERSAKIDSQGFQEMFQKHLYQDVSLLKQNQPSSVYNANVQPKNNYNSIDSYTYSKSGSMSNPVSNHRYPQSSNKFNPALSHLQTNTPGATNHSDDFALFSNFLYQYGFHNSSGPKQKSPP